MDLKYSFKYSNTIRVFSLSKITPPFKNISALPS
nr:MAG TPA: hypothetical protein [Caudoviricetes sp.]